MSTQIVPVAVKVVKQLTRTRTLATVAVAIFLYIVFGHRLLDVVAAVAGLTIVATFAVVLVESRKIQRCVSPPPPRSRLRVGELYLSEVPGFVWILLAGKEYRRAAAGILERRAKVNATAARQKPQCPAAKMDGMRCIRSPHQDLPHRDGRGDEWWPHPGVEELGRLMRAGSTSITDLHYRLGQIEGGRVAPRHILCLGCGALRPLASGRCGSCYQRYRGRIEKGTKRDG